MLLALPFGLAIGLTLGTVGGGGAVLAVPVLVYLLDQSVEAATTASLVVVAAAAVAGGYGHVRAGRLCWGHAATFAAASIPGLVAGTLLGNVLTGRWLIGGFGLVMLAAAVATGRRASLASARGEEAGRCPPLLLGRAGAAGLVVGVLTGLFGVGGGFVVVPVLALALGLAMRHAIGTSLAVVAATSLLGLAVHLAAGRSVDLRLALAMAAACAAGALAGGRLSGHLPQRALGTAFAVLVALVAVSLLVSAAGVGALPSA